LHAAIPLLSEEQLAPLIEATTGDGKVAPVSNTGGRANVALDAALNEFFYQPTADVESAMTDVCGKLTPALSFG
jgi:hypothetical protein